MAGGYVLLNRAGLTGFLSRVDGHRPWGAADLRARMARRLTPMQRRADADLRRLSFAQALRTGLDRLLARGLPRGTAYLNTGHSNLSDRVLRAFGKRPGDRISVLIHDVIPLDHPDMQRVATVARFRDMLNRVAAHADLVICNSDQTRRDLERVLVATPRRPDMIVAHLGVTPPVPDPSAVPAGLPPGGRPYFVTLGTIEPRKNHRLLLDAWEAMGPSAPVLLICGARGWRNEDVFARLDALPPGGPVLECPGLSDGAVAALVAGARGLLQPSIAEGFGLPPVEAAALGTPVICADLPVYREVLGDIPVYVPGNDRLSWIKIINDLARADGRTTGKDHLNAYVPPTWEAHFNTVLKVT